MFKVMPTDLKRLKADVDVFTNNRYRHWDTMTDVSPVYYTAKQYMGRGGGSLRVGGHPNCRFKTLILELDHKGTVISQQQFSNCSKEDLEFILDNTYRPKGYFRFSPSVPRR